MVNYTDVSLQKFNFQNKMSLWDLHAQSTCIYIDIYIYTYAITQIESLGNSVIFLATSFLNKKQQQPAPGQPFQVLDAFNTIGLEVQHLDGSGSGVWYNICEYTQHFYMPRGYADNQKSVVILLPAILKTKDFPLLQSPLRIRSIQESCNTPCVKHTHFDIPQLLFPVVLKGLGMVRVHSKRCVGRIFETSPIHQPQAPLYCQKLPGRWFHSSPAIASESLVTKDTRPSGIHKGAESFIS